MLENMEVFRMAKGLATHAAARQAVIAQNVANADTPGYRARDLVSFGKAFEAQTSHQMRATRTGHVMLGERAPSSFRTIEADRPGAQSPNGNNVSLETEMMMAAQISGRHRLAMAVYRSSLSMLRSSISSR